jgi:hypothetical protein
VVHAVSVASPSSGAAPARTSAAKAGAARASSSSPSRASRARRTSSSARSGARSRPVTCPSGQLLRQRRLEVRDRLGEAPLHLEAGHQLAVEQQPVVKDRLVLGRLGQRDAQRLLGARRVVQVVPVDPGDPPQRLDPRHPVELDQLAAEQRDQLRPAALLRVIIGDDPRARPRDSCGSCAPVVSPPST